MIIQIIVLLFSVVIHEVSHGLMAYRLGDPTAKYAGRLTLNPMKHLDPVGSFLVPLLLIVLRTGMLFGWAKPVPYNPYNLRDQKYGPALVGLAGPLSNVALALLAGLAMRILLVLDLGDGTFIYSFLSTMIFINILLTVFNLLPIPPLDGSKLLFTFLPISEHTKSMLEQYGFALVFAFVYLFSGFISLLLFAVLNLFSQYVVGVNILSYLN